MKGRATMPSIASVIASAAALLVANASFAQSANGDTAEPQEPAQIAPEIAIAERGVSAMCPGLLAGTIETDQITVLEPALSKVVLEDDRNTPAWIVSDGSISLTVEEGGECRVVIGGRSDQREFLNNSLVYLSKTAGYDLFSVAIVDPEPYFALTRPGPTADTVENIIVVYNEELVAFTFRIAPAE